MNTPLPLNMTLAGLPPIWNGEPLLEIRRHLRTDPVKLIVLDDDPTGTQTVEDIPVVTRWDEATLTAEFESPDRGFFILTNSRALDESQTIALHRELLGNLKKAAGGRPFTIVSRSDSTLRGHYEAETKVIEDVLGPFALKVVAPYFHAGGRFTLDDIHYVQSEDQLVPAHQTPFAADKVFGFNTSHLPSWIEEKTNGKTQAQNVISIGLDTIRSGGPDGVFDILTNAPAGAACVVNACTPKDIEVFAAAALRFEQSGRAILYRSAASLVAARLGLRPPPSLPAEFISSQSKNGGLIVVGSHVPKTTEQLSHLLDLDALEAVELDVDTLFASDDSEGYLVELAVRIQNLISSGKDVLLYTSRKLVFASSHRDNLDISGRVAKAIVLIVRCLEDAPGFVIAKGGITSSTIATDALEIRRATVLGQLVPGVPVWRADGDSRFPQIDLVIFPGNVGSPESLVTAYQKISRLRKAGA